MFEPLKFYCIMAAGNILLGLMYNGIKFKLQILPASWRRILLVELFFLWMGKNKIFNGVGVCN